jgi:hypothetical protein
MKSDSSRWRISRIIPGLIAIAFLLDLAPRFFPLNWLSFRAWEAMVHFHAPCGPLRSEATYENNTSYGDLAAMGNLPQLRRYHREFFSTDSYGYRRNQSMDGTSRPYRALLLGDSMSMGSSVSDGDTLSSQLERKLGVGVYNGASPDNALTEADRILMIARRLRIGEGTVVYQYLGRTSLPTLYDVSSSESATCNSWWDVWTDYSVQFFKVSPMQIVAQRLFKRLQNDLILPNIFRKKVVKKTLTNGATMLFVPIDVNRYGRNRSIQLEGIKYLSDTLAKHRLKLLVVLTPDKYTVYEPLLEDADNNNRTEAIYLDRVEAALKEAHIPVINLTGYLRQKARESLDRNEYIYWDDDSHWNPHGIDLAADEIVRQNLIH